MHNLKNRNFVVLFITITLLSACISHTSSVPFNHKKLKEVNSLSELNGVYENFADGYKGKTSMAISKMIWQGLKLQEHNQIKRIAVNALDDVTFQVRTVGYKRNLKKTMRLYSKNAVKDGAVNLSTYKAPSGPISLLLLTFEGKSGYRRVMLDTANNLILEISQSRYGLALGLPVSARRKTYLRFNKI